MYVGISIKLGACILQNQYIFHDVVTASRYSCQWIRYINVYRAAGVWDDRSKNAQKNVNNVNIIEFHNHIRNHHGKCIKISTLRNLVQQFMKLVLN